MTLVLASDAIRKFWEQGYPRIPEICPAPEVDWLRGVYDRLFEQRVGWLKGDFSILRVRTRPKAPLCCPS